MIDTIVSLRRKITRAADLQSVVRTMKALAASQIGQYEKSVHALVDYNRTVQLGLSACLRGSAPAVFAVQRKGSNVAGVISAVVFGSDQGLVGQFNDVVVDYTVKTLSVLQVKPQVWAVGERVYAKLIDMGLEPRGFLDVPTSAQGITPLVGQILVESETRQGRDEITELHLFYNRPEFAAIYAPVKLRVLPLDETWQRELSQFRWPTENIPEVLGSANITLRAFIREYLFVSLFRACAESLASENASRLAAMQRAEKNIDELLHELTATFNRLRQDGIDEELFDVISGFDALSVKKK